jgi:hypothetical protein
VPFRYRFLTGPAEAGRGWYTKPRTRGCTCLVAFKSLPDDVARDAPVLTRLQREAQAASALNHRT